MTGVSENVDALARRIVDGTPTALARGLSWIEAGGSRAEALSTAVYPHTGRAHIVGLTGAPGSGKSSLGRALAHAARSMGLTVGVLAVDPSSPFSGGAILGDRIRMNDLALDPGVFIRSMASRGTLGGLARPAADAIALMDAAGRQLVLVETVGVGQGEVEIMSVAHTVVVVSVPGLGDDIQTLKAGVLEIADVHVVNKMDRPGAGRTIAELKAMLALRGPRSGDWAPPIVGCAALEERGIDQLLASVQAHFDHLKTRGGLAERQRRMAEARVLAVARDIVAAALTAPAVAAEHEPLVQRVARRELAPHAGARMLMARMGASRSRGGRHDV